MDKKKIIAIILFILLGLFIFTFANPGPSTLEPVDNPGQGEEEIDSDKEQLDESDDEKEENDEIDQADRPVVEVDEAPIIEINPTIVTILFGQNYDVMTGINASDDNDIVRVNASITDTTKLEVGTHTITYTTSDRAGHTTTATRTIIVLNPTGDEDEDGYTNEEEIENGTNPDDKENHPDYNSNPTIDFSSCTTSMVVYDTLPNFEECVKATDEYYGTEGVTVQVTTDINPNQFGKYTVTVVAKDNLQNETTESFEFEVLKRDVTVTIDNITATYKDAVKPLTSNADEMAYNGNSIGVELSTEVTNTTPAGKYPITGTWTNENYNVTFVNGEYSINSKTITEEDIKELGIEFKDASFIYDGTAKYLSVNNLPKTFNVTYKNNGKVDADVYEVEAIITGDENYNGEIILNAFMIINKKEVIVNWEETTTFTYNGEKQLPTATVDGVEITIDVKEGNATDVGKYTAVATTTNKNYTLTNTTKEYEIVAKTLTEEDIKELGIEFKDASFTYDGTVKSIYVNNLPKTFNVTYKNNGKVDADVYEVEAIITGDENYNGEITLKATMTINPKAAKVYWIDRGAFIYNGEKQLPTATAEYGVEITIDVKEGNATDAGKYIAVATTTNKNYTLTNTTKEYEIVAKTLTEEDIKELGITFEDASFVYDGEKHSIYANNLPEGFSVRYENNEKVDVRSYEVKAIITGSGNYTGEITLTATMIINPKEVTVVWTSRYDFVYNGQEQIPTATAYDINHNNLITNVTVTGGNAIDAGKYTAVALTSNGNYTLTNATYDYEITKATPSYTIPTDLEAEEGQTLDDIKLPEGFTFDEDPTTVLEEGEYTTTITYTPKDSDNYDVVEGIEVTIKVNSSKFDVTFVDWDGKILDSQKVKKGESAIAPTSPSRTNWTFIGWDKDFTNVQENLTITAQYKANQTGIEVVEKPNVQFQFQKGKNPDFTKLITVYEVYADGSKKETTNYTTDVDTSEVVDNKVLTIKENGFTNNDIKYSVINEEAYQSKFEVDFTGLNYYYETKNEICGSNCDSERNTEKVETDYNFLEIVEHYDENIVVTNVSTKYTNGNIENLIISDSIRWTHKSGGAKYNPVYIATTNRTKTITEEYEECHWEWFNRVCETKYRDVVVTDDIMNDEYIIDTVEITYEREGFGTYTIYFKYDQDTNEFKPYDEIKIS